MRFQEVSDEYKELRFNSESRVHLFSYIKSLHSRKYVQVVLVMKDHVYLTQLDLVMVN